MTHDPSDRDSSQEHRDAQCGALEQGYAAGGGTDASASSPSRPGHRAPEARRQGAATGVMLRRDYLRALGVTGTAGAVGSTATTATAQSGFDEAAANQGVRENQTGPLTVEVVDQDGNPVSGAAVGVEMREHEFGFGTAVGGDLLVNQFDDGDPFREHLLDLFNTAVLGNDHKWAIWEGNQSLADQAVDWLDSNGLDVRGHTCIYPVDYAIPGDVQTAIDSGDGRTIRDRTIQHIEEIITHYGDRVQEWDVVNEVLHRGLLHSGVYPGQIDLDDLPSGEIQPWRSQLLADWFSQAESVIDEHGLDVDVVTNDYNTMTWSYARNRYAEQIEFLEDQGVDLDAIGLQAHVGAQKDNSQEWTYGAIQSVFEHYSQFDAAQRITEFDMYGDGWTDDQQRAEIFERFLRTAYGHPDVDEFLIWGMWDQSHWQSEAPFFEADWSEKPALDVWRTLVQDEWWTSEAGTTGSDGTYTVDAFLGEHEVTVSTDAGSTTQTASVTDADGGTRLVVSVEAPSACAGAADAGGGSAEVDGRTVCDVDGDGLHRDVTGDGTVGQTDVVEFFERQHRSAWKRPELFDFSGNGAVGHGDVVALFEAVATGGA